MSSNNAVTYYVIFDTNALFQSYEKMSDFTSFSFNSTYQNVIDMINKLDIYGRVVIEVPVVVWNEMEKQIIESHNERLRQYESTISKRKFPEYSVIENPKIDYSSYIREKIIDYKESLNAGLNTVEELPVASEACFNSIVNRAFEKLPPFEGKDKKSDKGFKDALIWESILEFASKHTNSKIMYYTNDKIFDNSLIKEFENKISDSTIYM